MIKKLVFAVIVIAIAASIAYQMGWLSFKGEDLYEDARESVMEKGEEAIEKGKDAID